MLMSAQNEKRGGRGPGDYLSDMSGTSRSLEEGKKEALNPRSRDGQKDKITTIRGGARQKIRA